MEKIKFEFTKEQVKKLNAWKATLPTLPQGYFGVNGGGFEFIFIPTSIGTIVKARRTDGDGHEIDLTEYEYF